MEGMNGTALTGDYLRVSVRAEHTPDPSVLHHGSLSRDGSSVTVDAGAPLALN